MEHRRLRRHRPIRRGYSPAESPRCLLPNPASDPRPRLRRWRADRAHRQGERRPPYWHNSSPAMLAAARERGLSVVDATARPYESEFDAVFSNAALHWMPAEAQPVPWPASTEPFAPAAASSPRWAASPTSPPSAPRSSPPSPPSASTPKPPPPASTHRLPPTDDCSKPPASPSSPSTSSPAPRPARRHGVLAQHLPQWRPRPPHSSRPCDRPRRYRRPAPTNPPRCRRQLDRRLCPPTLPRHPNLTPKPCHPSPQAEDLLLSSLWPALAPNPLTPPV